MIGIYKITNPKGKIYIGKSKNIEKRLKHYKSKSMPYIKQQPKIYNSLKKYGWEKHKFDILEECDLKNIDVREIYWINLYESNNRYNLNCTEGGDGGKLNKDILHKMHEKICKPILQYDLEGNFIKEFKSSVEARNHINKGNSNNINDCARGKYKTTYGFQWVYKNDYIEPFIGSPIKNKRGVGIWDEEQRDKFNDTIKNRNYVKKEYPEWGIKHFKKVYQYNLNNELINEYPSRNELYKTKIINPWNFRKIINKNIQYKGYKYYDNKI